MKGNVIDDFQDLMILVDPNFSSKHSRQSLKLIDRLKTLILGMMIGSSMTSEEIERILSRLDKKMKGKV